MRGCQQTGSAREGSTLEGSWLGHGLCLFPMSQTCVGHAKPDLLMSLNPSLAPNGSRPSVGIPDVIAEAVEAAQRIMYNEENGSTSHLSGSTSINVLYDPEEEMVGATTEIVTVRPALDSGSVDNVIHPKELPNDANTTPNNNDSHFVGANNSRIEKFGTCDTSLESKCGKVGCHWKLADVSRPLHSVSRVTGPKDGPGKQDVIFNNRVGVVVPPGIVDEILKRVKPLARYEREGNLYVGEFQMSAFGRQSQEP